MAQWCFWNEKQFSDVYGNIYIRSFVEDWFAIVFEIVKEINACGAGRKEILDIGCGEGHTTKQILDRIEGPYSCDLLEPDRKALESAKHFLGDENFVGSCFPSTLKGFASRKKYDIVFTSHTNYYWSERKKDYDVQLKRLVGLLKNGGKLIVLTLPSESDHYKVMLKQIYPEFNHAQYIEDFYASMGFNVKVKKMTMRMYVGDLLSTRSSFDLASFYRFIHSQSSNPSSAESKRFLDRVRRLQNNNYLDFRDHLIIVQAK